MSQKKLLSASLLASLAILTASSVSLAQSAADANSNKASQPINLDLSSAEKNLTAAHLLGGGSVNILLEGNPVSVNGQTNLTPAERLAVYQVVSSGAQSIMLGSNGVATGGSLTIGSRFNDFVSSLTVPQGVTVLFDAAKNPAMNLLGNLNNAGAIYAYSSNSQFNSANISALNIINQSGAVLSSVVPTALMSNITNFAALTNLNLYAVQNIINSGTISSVGNLSLTAGNSILNMGAGGNFTPLMQSTGVLNMQALNIVNEGIVASLTNNLNLSTASLTNTGTIQALLGNASIQSLLGNTLAINNGFGQINVRDVLSFNTGDLLKEQLTLPPVLSITGGALSGSAIAMVSPYGDINLDLYRLNGDLSIKGTNANIRVEGGSLNITNLDLSGDPSFTNVTGDVNLGPGSTTPGLASFNIFSGGPVFNTGGALFNVSAGGDILALNGAAGTVNASLFGGTGGAITLTAGTGPNGGSVILPTVNFKTNANSITITATASATNSGSVSVGTLNTSGAGGVCCNTSPGTTAPAGQAAGNIIINAPGGISTGSIQAFGGGGAGGYCCASSGGAGGNGGLVQLTSNGNIVVGGEINTSGGGGGGLSASQIGSTFGGKGGNAGNIVVNTPGSFLSFGPLLAAGGGGGAGNTVPPCCPQGYRNGGGSFGGGGGGGDVGAGGGGFYGGGGSLSFGSGGGGGFFGGGGGSNGQPAGTLGQGGSSTEGVTLFFTGGVFGAAGGGKGSFGGDGNLINNTFVNEKGFGNAGGAAGSNGNINMTAKSVQVASTVGQFFPGAGFTTSPFAKVTVFGNYSGPQVNAPAGSVAPTNTVNSIPVPREQVIPTVGLSSTEIASLFGLTSQDGSQSGSVRNFDTSGIQNVTDWGLNMSSTGSLILVNDPNSSNRSLNNILASQPTGVSSLGNSLSSAMNSLDSDIGQIYVSLSRRTGVDYKAPGHEASGYSNNGPLVNDLTDPITISMVNALFSLLQVRNELAAHQAALEGRYSWVVVGSYGALPTYDDGEGFVSAVSYNQAYSPFESYAPRPTSNAEFSYQLMTGDGILDGLKNLTGGEGEGPSGGSGGSETDASVSFGKAASGTGNGVPITLTPYTKTGADGKVIETGVVAKWGKDGSEYTYPGAVLGGVGSGQRGVGQSLTLANGQLFQIPSGGNGSITSKGSILSLKNPANMTKGPIDSTTGGFQPGTNNRSTQTTPEQNNSAINEVNRANTPPPTPIYDLPFLAAMSMQTSVAAAASNLTEDSMANAETLTRSSDHKEQPFKFNSLKLGKRPVLAEVENSRRVESAIERLQATASLTREDLRVSPMFVHSKLPWLKAFLLAVKLKCAAQQLSYMQDKSKSPAQSSGVTARNQSGAGTHRNFFLCPTEKTEIQMSNSKISIAAGAKVLVLNNGHSVGIYTLHDNHRVDVSVSCDGSTICATPGRFIVLSSVDDASFDKVNPARPIAIRNLKKLPTVAGSIYTGEFSPVSALTAVSCLRDLAHSKEAADKKTYNSLIKTTLAVMQLQRGGVPFKNSASIPTANYAPASSDSVKIEAEKISMLYQ